MAQADWPTDPGHQLKLMGEIMWEAAPKTTIVRSARDNTPFCSKAQRLAAKRAATCRAATIAIGAFQRLRLEPAAWPLLANNIRKVLEERGPSYPVPRSHSGHTTRFTLKNGSQRTSRPLAPDGRCRT